MPLVKTLRKIFSAMASPAAPPWIARALPPALVSSSANSAALAPDARSGVFSRRNEIAPMMATSLYRIDRAAASLAALRLVSGLAVVKSHRAAPGCAWARHCSATPSACAPVTQESIQSHSRSQSPTEVCMGSSHEPGRGGGGGGGGGEKNHEKKKKPGWGRGLGITAANLTEADDCNFH